MYLKKIIIYVFLSICLSVSTLQSAETPVVESCISPFFNALRNGDVATVKQYIADPLYSEIESRLNAAAYPDFLRKYYSNSSIEVININHITDDQKSVKLDLYFSSNEKQSLELKLQKSADGDWKITNQSEIRE